MTITVAAMFSGLDRDLAITHVSDGGPYRTLEAMHALCGGDPRVTLANLNCNVGKELAITVGFEHACCDAIIAIDADLQDPTEVILSSEGGPVQSRSTVCWRNRMELTEFVELRA